VNELHGRGQLSIGIEELPCWLIETMGRPDSPEVIHVGRDRSLFKRPIMVSPR
jgi:hypothetical protein